MTEPGLQIYSFLYYKNNSLIKYNQKCYNKHIKELVL